MLNCSIIIIAIDHVSYAGSLILCLAMGAGTGTLATAFIATIDVHDDLACVYIAKY
jgi:hypothetical protein